MNSDSDARGFFADTETQELPNAVQNYLDLEVSARESDRTYINKRQSYRHYARFCDETEREFLTPSVRDVEKFITHQLAAGYAKSTVENRVYDLSALFRELTKDGIVEHNPVDMPPGQESVELDDVRTRASMSQIRYIEPKDYQKMLDECDKLRDEVILRILWECGIRSKELVSLTVEQVEEGREGKEITLETAKKYETVERTVFYSYKLKDALTRWMDEGGRKQYNSHVMSEYLLLGRGSKQLKPNRPTEIIRDLAEAAGVQASLGEPDAAGNQRRTVTAHAFRHSFAVHRVRNGCPIVFLSDLMGHSDISQTREYLKFRNEDIRDADRKYRPPS